MPRTQGSVTRGRSILAGTMSTTRAHIGLDFGGVVVPLLERGRTADTQFADQFLRTAPQPGAEERIARIVHAVEGRVSLVSKAGPRTEAMTRAWLRERDFLRTVGIGEERLHFCRSRADKEPICRELGITHFVDDRIAVLQILRTTVPHLYLFGDPAANRSARRWTTLVENWDEACAAILGDLDR